MAVTTVAATTASGTAFTQNREPLPGGIDQLFFCGTAAAFAKVTPMIVIYFHGSGGTNDQLHTTAAWRQIRDWLIDNDIITMEVYGNLGSVYNGRFWWFRDPGHLAYEAGYALLQTHLPNMVGRPKTCLFTRSMGGGGLQVLWLDGAIKDDVIGVLHVSSVYDLAYEFSQGKFNLSNFWNVDAGEQDEFETVTEDYDPGQQDVADYLDDMPVCIIVGDSDETVDATENGLKLWARGTDQANDNANPVFDMSKSILKVKAGGTHESNSSGTYYEFPTMSTFLGNVFGITSEVEPGDGTYNQVTGVWRYEDGEMYAVTAFPAVP